MSCEKRAATMNSNTRQHESKSVTMSSMNDKDFTTMIIKAENENNDQNP